MSRTRKDVPYRVLAERRGRPVEPCGPDCGIPQTYVRRIKAAVPSADTRTLEKIRTICAEYEYNLYLSEVFGVFKSNNDQLADLYRNSHRAPVGNPLHSVLTSHYGKVTSNPPPTNDGRTPRQDLYTLVRVDVEEMTVCDCLHQRGIKKVPSYKGVPKRFRCQCEYCSGEREETIRERDANRDLREQLADYEIA